MCTRPIPKCPPPSPGHRQGTIAYVGIIDATSRATTDGANNKLARTHSLVFMDVANIPVSLENDSSLWLANSLRVGRVGTSKLPPLGGLIQNGHVDSHQ